MKTINFKTLIISSLIFSLVACAEGSKSVVNKETAMALVTKKIQESPVAVDDMLVTLDGKPIGTTQPTPAAAPPKAN